MDDKKQNGFRPENNNFDPEEDLKKRREELRQKLRESKEYREQYATSTLVAGISTQMVALRRQRGLKQEDLKNLTGINQPRISKIEATQLSERVPNWELDTLNRVAQGLGCRLKVTFETYGSLVEESTSPQSLRRPDVESDRILNPLPDVMPQPDPDAPERTQWMQERMIPWLYDDENPEAEATLKRWLQGYGLPPVGHDESPAEWVLRGIPTRVPRSVREKFERRLAERLQVLLEQEPDLHPDVKDRPEEYLIALYSVCAGLRRPAYLAEPLWATYKRLHQSKLDREVRNALQAALITNQEGDKALNEIWKPMVENGKHRLLPGRELTGMQGMLAYRIKGKPDYPLLLASLQTISRRWTGTPEDVRAFDRILESFPDPRVLLTAVWNGDISLSAWANDRLPVVPASPIPTPKPSVPEPLIVAMGDLKCTVVYKPGALAKLSIKTPSALIWQGDLVDVTDIPEKENLVYNSVSTQLGDLLENQEMMFWNDISFMKAACWVRAKQTA